jgi:hypothetical protein
MGLSNSPKVFGPYRGDDNQGKTWTLEEHPQAADADEFSPTV